MRRFIPVVALLLAGCAADRPVSGVYRTTLAAQAYNASPCSSSSPAMAAAPAAELGSYYAIGSQDYAKAGLQIPANAVICAGQFLRCLTDVFFPQPQPSLRFAALMPTQSLPPAAPRPPEMPVAAPPRAPCTPVACLDDDCNVPGK